MNPVDCAADRPAESGWMCLNGAPPDHRSDDMSPTAVFDALIFSWLQVILTTA